MQGGRLYHSSQHRWSRNFSERSSGREQQQIVLEMTKNRNSETSVPAKECKIHTGNFQQETLKGRNHIYKRNNGNDDSNNPC